MNAPLAEVIRFFFEHGLTPLLIGAGTLVAAWWRTRDVAKKPEVAAKVEEVHRTIQQRLDDVHERLLRCEAHREEVTLQNTRLLEQAQRLVEQNTRLIHRLSPREGRE